MAALVGLLIVFLLIGLTVGLGAPWLIFVPIILVLGVIGWAVFAFAAGRQPAEAVRETKPVELLGPGGPDDPDRAQHS